MNLYRELAAFVYKHRIYSFLKKHGASYKPQPITWGILCSWLSQFELDDRASLFEFVKHLQFLDEETVIDRLVSGNEKILRRLKSSDIALDQTIYVQIHDAGSSSGVLLGQLRDAAGLQNSGVHLIDASSRKLSSLTSSIGEGAIIYVDDVSATGEQFSTVRTEISQFIVGSFAEYFLTASICEEASERLDRDGVETNDDVIHFKSERPLHPDSTLLKPKVKDKLLEISKRIHKRWSLGFQNMATMVVIYRQCPNTAPLLFRGNKNQTPYMGVFPRTDDKPSSIHTR